MHDSGFTPSRIDSFSLPLMSTSSGAMARPVVLSMKHVLREEKVHSLTDIDSSLCLGQSRHISITH